MDLPRVMPALITPFSRDGSLDLESHTFNLRTLRERQVAGFLVAGSTGEGPYLEPGERRELARALRQELGGEVTVIVGVAAETVRSALAQIAEAETAGADAVLVQTPTSLTRGQEAAVITFYVNVADTSPLPLLLYSVPAYTAYEIPVASVLEVAAHPVIIGMKDSGGHPVRIATIVDSVPDDFVLYAGASAAVGPSMTSGAHGAITASTNYAPELVHRVVETEGEERRRAQVTLRELAGVVEAHRIPGIKTAAEAAGLKAGHPRLPLQRLEGPLATQIHRVMADYQARASTG